MENEIYKLVAGQGVFALLFVYMLLYVLKENSKRETKYQQIIEHLTEKFNKLEDVQNTVIQIKNKIDNQLKNL